MHYLLDALLAIAFLLSLIAGWRNGFFRELFSILGLVAGVIGGFRLTAPLLAYLPENVRRVPGIHVVGFVILFFVLFFFLQLVGFALSRVVEGKDPPVLSRIFGVLLGALRGLALLVLLAAAVLLIAPIGSATLGRSRVLPYLTRPVLWSASLLPEDLSNRIVRRWQAIPFAHPTLPASDGQVVGGFGSIEGP